MSGEELTIMEEITIPFSLVAATGATTVLLASALAYVLMKRNHNKSQKVDAAEETTHTLDRTKYPGGQVNVYFATQTGTAESFAKQLQEEGATKGFHVDIVDLEDVQVSDLLLLVDPNKKKRKKKEEEEQQTAASIFLCSTYGEGEPPDNATSFCAQMQSLLLLQEQEEEEKKEVDDDDDNMIRQQQHNNNNNFDYCVFGLGNTQYEHYNAMGKLFDTQLEQLGGRRIVELGLGNDDDDIEADFEKWKEERLWPCFQKNYLQNGGMALLPNNNNNNNNDTTSKSLPETPYRVEYLSNNNNNNNKNNTSLAAPHETIHTSSKHYFTSVECPITVNRELRHSSDPGSTKHIEIDISKAPDFSYQTADNLGVLPVNNDEVVQSVAKSLGYDLEAVFTVHASEGHEWHGAPFPMPLTIRTLLQKYCDLTGSPRRSDLKHLSAYATSDLDRKALVRMSSKEGKAEYKEKIVEAHVGLVDVLQLCPSLELPLEHFLAVCPRLLPRYYTIASSSSVHPKSVHLTVAVTETLRNDGSLFRGVCSSYLAATVAAPTRTVQIFRRDSGFRLPADSTKPILMIGPGTGVAPMRALLQERLYQRDVLQQNVGPNILYFGCKTESQDYLYKEEWEEYYQPQQSNNKNNKNNKKKKSILTQFHVAFSRAQTNHPPQQQKKVYVQHLLAQNASETWNLIHEQGAYIYVCGGVRMGADVGATIRDICATHLGNNKNDNEEEEAQHYVTQLVASGRYIQELWA